MKIGVLLKQVPDTETRIRIADDASGIVTDDIKWVINPYDEHALEEALKLKDARKAKEVVIFSLGGKGVDQRIREGLARGAERGVWIEAPENLDSLAIARALAAAVKAEGVDLLLAGKQAVDDDNSQVPAMVAEILGWPQVMMISELQIDDGGFKATRDVGKGVRQVVEGRLPAVISCDKSLNTPRYASLPGIMKARRKKIDNKNISALGVDTSSDPLVSHGNWGLPPERSKGQVIPGEPKEAVKELVRLLREEAKVL